MSPSRLLLVPLGLLALTLLGAGAATAAEVDITGFRFQPQTLTIEAGETVTWRNADGAAHTATSDGGAWTTATLGQGEADAVTFAEPGTYSYSCKLHPSMRGTVVVNAAATPGSNETAPDDASEDAPAAPTEEDAGDEPDAHETPPDGTPTEPGTDHTAETPGTEETEASSTEAEREREPEPTTTPQPSPPTTQQDRNAPFAGLPLALAGILVLAVLRRTG